MSATSTAGGVAQTSRSEMVSRPGGEGLVRWWEPQGEAIASLVIAHGYAEHSGRYEAVGARLAASGLAVWTTDVRGHGRASGERASVAAIGDLVDDVHAVVVRARAARAGLPLFLLGHSMGGLVATTLALAHPGKLAGLILSGPAVGDPSGIEPLLDLDPLPEVVLSSEMLARDLRVGADYDADPLNYRGSFRRETLRALTGGARAVRGRFAELRLPLLVLHGAEDQLVVAAASEDLFAGASSADKELTIYPGLRHEILNEPEGPEITDRIAAWVRTRCA